MLIDFAVFSLLCGMIGKERLLLGRTLEGLDNFWYKWATICIRTEYKSILLHMHTAGRVNVLVELMFLEVIQGQNF